MNGKCRDACGPDCPDTCDKSEYNECTKDGKAILVVTKYICGTHQGCRDHDDCLDACIAPYEYGNFPGTDVTWADVEFWGVGGCQRDCHLEALEYASQQFPGQGPSTVHSWASGGGPYDGSDTWEYTRDTKDGPDRIEPCGECEYCWSGVCWEDEDCEPCNSCGDVHLYTLDGLKYDFQGAGEYTLLKSTDGSFVVQARQQPWGGRATVNKAVAMNVAGVKVGIYVPDVLRVDGREVTMEMMSSLDLASGGTVRRLRKGYMVKWPNGARVTVRTYGKHFNIGVVLPDEMNGLVKGILGNFDGEAANDLVSATGQQFERRMTFEQLHREYGDSWRITQTESLFDYAGGENSSTYQLFDFPEQHVRASDLSQSDRDRAAEACRAAGVKGDEQMKDCIFDVAVTGDKVFAVSNERSKTLVRESVTVENGGGLGDEVGEASDIEIIVEEPLYAGFDVDVALEGTTADDDMITIVASASPVDELGNRVSVRNVKNKLMLPVDPGSYELRYVTNARPRKVLARRRVEILPLEITLEAPREAKPGQEIEVVARGTLNPKDYLTIVPAGSSADEIDSTIRLRISSGTLGVGMKRTLHVTVPDAPGNYEIRHVTENRPRQSFAAAPLTVR